MMATKLVAWARAGAIGVALLAAIDPTITVSRRAPVDLVVIPSGPSDSAAANQAAQGVADRFNVLRAPMSTAAATVVVGRSLPGARVSGPIFVTPTNTTARIERIDVPPLVQLDSRQAIDAVIGGSGRIDARLEVDGVVVDRDTVDAATTGSTAHFELAPTRTGLTRLRIIARRLDSSDSTIADASTVVTADPWRVLVFDRRPSWMSTFVRRALEADRRFAVASRVVTSGRISTAAGTAPSTLAEPLTLDLYDVIIVGAPESLSAADVSGLESFLRRRGGSVVLLFDTKPTGGPYDRLTGVTRWSSVEGSNVLRIADAADTAAMRATEIAWPASSSVIPLASTTSPVHPVAWSRSVGAGQVYVSGALDAWKFRDALRSGFGSFWRKTVATAAAEALAPVDITLEPRVASPGQRVRATIALRDKTSGTASLTRVVGGSALSIPTWPGRNAGELVAEFRAPPTGDYRVEVVADGLKGEATGSVATGIIPPSPDDSAAMAAIATTSGGAVVSLDRGGWSVLSGLAAATRPEPWHPMREWWWLPVFVALLGVEWLVRRRNGLA